MRCCATIDPSSDRNAAKTFFRPAAHGRPPLFTIFDLKSGRAETQSMPNITRLASLATARVGSFVSQKPVASAAAFGAIGACLASVYTLVQTPVYSIRASVVFPLPVATGSSGLAAIAGPFGPNPLDMFVGVANARDIKAHVMRALGLRDVEEVADHYRCRILPEENKVVLIIEHEETQRALETLKSTLTQIRDASTRVALSRTAAKAESATQALDFHTTRLAQAEIQLAQLQAKTKLPIDPTIPASMAPVYRRLQDAQVTLKTVEVQLAELSRQTQVAAGTLGAMPTFLTALEPLRANVRERRFTYEQLSTKLGPDAPDLKMAKNQLDLAEQMLRREVEGALAAAESRVAPKLAELEAQRVAVEIEIAALTAIAEAQPGEALTITRANAEVQDLRNLVTLLKTLVQTATIEAAADPYRWEILDSPYVEDKPINKKYALHGIFGALLCIGVWAIVLRFPRSPSKLNVV